MLRPLYILILGLLWSLVMPGQSHLDLYRVQDSLIEGHLKSENYPEAVQLIEKQLQLINKNEMYDSLYHYCYDYGRALWKTMGAEKGIEQAWLLAAEVQQKDTHILHYLQTLNDLSWLYYETGQIKKCFEIDSLYLETCLTNKDVPVEKISMAYYNLGFSFMEVGKYRDALEHFEASVDVILASGEEITKQLSLSYNALGAAQWHLGFLEAAKKSYSSSLALIEHDNDPASVLEKGNIIGNMALVLQDNGEIIRSKEYQERMIKMDLAVLPLIEDVWLKETAMRRVTSSYINLAAIYNLLGDYSKSIKLTELAIEERKKILEPNDPSLASAIESLAFIELRSGNYQEAELKMTAYAIYCQRNFGETSVKTSSAYKEVAVLYLGKQEYDKSLEFFNKAIRSQKLAGNPDGDPYLASIYRERSALFAKMGHVAKALEDLTLSMQIYAQSGRTDSRMFIAIYLEMAEVKISSGDIQDASKDIEMALALLSEKRSTLQLESLLLPEAYYLKALVQSKADTGATSLRLAMKELQTAIKYLKTYKLNYLDEDSKLMLYDAHKKIFELAEDIAYSLYEKTNDKKWVEIFFSLTEENRTILLRSRLQNFSALDFAGVPDSILNKERELLYNLSNENEDLQAMKDVVDMERQYEALVNHIKEQYPEYYALKHNDQSFSIAEVQENLLTDGTNLVSYSLTTNSVYILVVDRINAHLAKMPIGNLKADILNLNQALVQNNLPVFDSLSASLYELLFMPIKSKLTSNEVVIVPDDDLFFLNFEILPDQFSDSISILKKMLIHEYIISYYLSTTVSMQFKGLKNEGPDRLLSFAPGFTDRQKQEYAQTIKDTSQLDKKYLTYIQQPFAVQTAKQIAGIFSGTTFIEEEADETNFKKEAAKYGVIHLGTHAEINQNSPLMSHLVLSKNVVNDSTDDGYLYAYEIYQMPLHAELAVLSACETGIGKQQNSEGIISLAHSFSYAGCPSIVMSLWNIDEKTSAGIIADFYHHLSEGMHKNKALRQAKLDYLKDAPLELQSPYYWAGLVLLGDHGPVNIKSNSRWKSIALIVIVLLAILSFIVVRRKN